MTDTDQKPEPVPPPPAVEPVPPANPLRRATLIVVVIGVVLFFYGIAADRYTPYTSQAVAQAYLIRVAPEVGGRVIEIGVQTDQRVKAGEVLFRLDPDLYALVVRRAQAHLESIGQSVGASTAAVATAQARLAEAVAKLENVRDQTARIFELIRKGVYPAARRAPAQAALDSAKAVVSQAESELEKARQALGPTGAANPQVREAMAALAQANLDLQRTTVLAPSEGFVTSLSLAVGQLLAKNEPAMTYIDLREIWIEAAFREVSLESIAVGDPVEIVLDILPGRVLAGHVSSLGYGVANRSVDPQTGLPSPRPQSGWIRPSQPVPVRIEFNEPIQTLRYGSQASVMVYSRKNVVMNAIGYVRMRLTALLAYVQ